MTAAEKAALKKRRRREWLLTFSPGEWIWVIGTFSALFAFWLAGSPQ